MISGITELFNHLNHTPQNIIISRTDSIGDVVLTLPMAAVLKKFFPAANIGFIGKAYTKPVISACRYIDAFIDREDFLAQPVTICGAAPDAILHVFPDPAIANRARRLGIPLRIGTTNRIYHWLTCNKLVKLSRRHSNLHEAQLNLKLLEPFGYKENLSLQQIGHLFGLSRLQPLPGQFAQLLHPAKFNLVLHPKSQGNGREWGLDNFVELIRMLDKDRYHIFISGTEKERPLLQPLFKEAGNRVTDITGAMNLDTFIAFIAGADGLVASGTGPLHIAAALGKAAMGIFPPIRPIHPGRWAPLGPKAAVFVSGTDNCADCKKNSSQCHCIRAVLPLEIKNKLDKQEKSTG